MRITQTNQNQFSRHEDQKRKISSESKSSRTLLTTRLNERQSTSSICNPVASRTWLVSVTDGSYRPNAELSIH